MVVLWVMVEEVFEVELGNGGGGVGASHTSICLAFSLFSQERQNPLKFGACFGRKEYS